MLDTREGYKPLEIMGYTYLEYLAEDAHPEFCQAQLTDKEGRVEQMGRVQPVKLQADYISAVICEWELEATYRELNKIITE